nr:hypothetical protein GCM10020092_075330 [Actinoplanes digitatis]
MRVLEEAVAAEPLDEVGQARLITAYQAAGRRAQAFAAFHRVRGLLADELGVDPGLELIAAHEALLRQDGAAPERANGAAPPPRRRSPSCLGRGVRVHRPGGVDGGAGPPGSARRPARRGCS